MTEARYTTVRPQFHKIQPKHLTRFFEAFPMTKVGHLLQFWHGSKVIWGSDPKAIMVFVVVLQPIHKLEEIFLKKNSQRIAHFNRDEGPKLLQTFPMLSSSPKQCCEDPRYL